MNAEAERLVMAKQVQYGDLSTAEQRRAALQTLRIRTVIKESHCSPVLALSFNNQDEECSNVFATVGRNQATVYDDQHMGDYVGVIVQYVNAETEHNKGGDLRACTWLNPQSWTDHPQGDACVAVAGADLAISVISIVEARVVLQLRGHKREIVDLAASVRRPDLLASLSRDGELRLWDVPAEACVACAQAEATSVAFDRAGSLLITGGKRGNLDRWDVSCFGAGPKSPTKAKKRAKTPVCATLERQAWRSGGSGSHLEQIDCVTFLDASRVASKSADGRVIVADAASGEQLATWKIPGCSASGDLDARCRFGATADGAVMCAGNSRGEVFLYETFTGERLAQLAATKVSGPVRACGLSEDCRHVLAAVGNGFIFRFEATSEGQGGAAGDAAAMEE